MFNFFKKINIAFTNLWYLYHLGSSQDQEQGEVRGLKWSEIRFVIVMEY